MMRVFFILIVIFATVTAAAGVQLPSVVEFFGMLDNAVPQYAGNQLVAIVNPTQGGNFEGRTGVGVMPAQEITYDFAGRILSDESRGIDHIYYDNDGHPVRIDFTAGHRHLLTYDGLGRLMSVAYFQQVSSAAGTGTSTHLQRTAVRRYTGAGHVIDNDSVKMTRFPGGYLDRGGNAFYYLTDYQGNNIAVVDAGGSITQRTYYYPYGEPWRYPDGQQYLYSDKELTRADGRHVYTFPARTLLPNLPRWSTPDPLAEQTPWDSPYAYCAANPIANIDPTGLSTFVVNAGDGIFNIVGGEIDDDRSIYFGHFDNNSFTKDGVLGITPTVTSFYDTDTQQWATDCSIDINDQSGSLFLTDIFNNTPNPITYANNAGNGQVYDFKATNGNIPTNRELKHYRGMPIPNSESDQAMYASARDIGNIVAGYITGYYKVPWGLTRMAFDAYNLKKNWQYPEGQSSQAAQFYGYQNGNEASTALIVNIIHNYTMSFTNSVISLSKKITNLLGF